MSDHDDWDIDATEDPEEETVDIDYEITSYPADTTLAGYLTQWDNNQLDVPDFQRSYVWDQTRASKLIESFLLGLPVPGVFLYKERKSKKFLIIDGQQRIKSIVYFLKGQFNNKIFKLKRVTSRWEGKSFTQLDEEDKFALENSVMRATVIQQISPEDHTSVYHIFERLNTGGINLNPMEIRKCVAHGDFADALERMNANDDWQRILGRHRPDKRMRDVELVLRIIALSEKINQYNKPMKGFLNGFMEEKRKISDFEKIVNAFSDACHYIIDSVGETPFHYRQRLNYGLLDAVFVSILTKRKPEKLSDVLEALKKDSDFVSCITRNTSDTNILKKRIKIAAKYF
ncbi:MAG: DUF262 domain-containing protein [Magnetococcales bacterium]|nr:DUF262 domain-containing protein [Magnetococcales bacterium]